MRRFHHLFSIFFLSAFLLISLVYAPQSNAITGAQFAEMLIKHKSIQDYGKEFCDKRSGDLMNLETWFSGKCGKDIDTLSGEGVGFSDIVILQGIETLIGPQQQGLLEQLAGMVAMLKDIRGILGERNSLPLDQKIALVQQKYPNNNQGLVSQASGVMTSLLLTKPAGTADYIQYVASNLQKKHIIEPAYAAASPGYGFTSLSPILPVWRAFRNVSYLLFALAFVLYGVMIMFRIRIDPKTAATVQLAIPKLIATLLLITFSYAIVGFLVDISTVITGVAVNILSAGGILNLQYLGTAIVPLANGTGFGWLGSLFVNTTVALIVAPFIVISFIIGPFAGFTGALVGVLGMLFSFGWIIGIIIIIAILISYVKLILKLFEAFISIIVNLIFAPIILLGNILPGSNAFSSWMLSIVGNLAVFPTAVFFLTLSYALMVQPFFNTILTLAPQLKIPLDLVGLQNILGVNQLSAASSIWTPPLTFVLIPGIQGDIMLSAIGFGLLLMASKYVDMVKDALKVPPFKYGSAIGEGLRSGVNINELWAKSGYAGLPGGPTGGLKGAMGTIYGDAANPTLKGTNISIGNTVKAVTDATKG